MEYDPNKNAHLKSRRRFKADLADVQEFCRLGYAVQGLVLKEVTFDEEEEGSFTVLIEDGDNTPVLTASFMVSDTSEYPHSHSFFCHSNDPDVSGRIESLMESVNEQRPRVIKELLDWFVTSLAKVVAASAKAKASRSVSVDPESDVEESEDEYEAFEFDDEIDLGAVTVEPNTVLYRLQQHFLDTIGSNYKPGIIRTGGGDDFIISVSIPVIELAKTIPPRALMAWDRHLLSRYQHFTLLISGFRGLYPVLESDGNPTPAATQLAVTPTFYVGLTQRYKPGKEQAAEVVRKHGLLHDDTEDQLRQEAEKAAAAAAYWDDDQYMDDGEWQEPIIEQPQVEEVDPDRFERFSLTSSLESLMQQSFLRVVQLRRQFGLGWAGAELLLAEIEKSQRPPQEVYSTNEDAILAADKEEEALGRTSQSLPHDPLKGLTKSQSLNLPLTAFSYLIRRLSLCTKYCLVCHNKLSTDFEALKPYVCSNKLCSYQYYSMGRGPSIEYEITHNPRTVDLLVSLTYVAAVEGALDDPLPVGLGLRVRHPGVLPPSSYRPAANRPFGMASITSAVPTPTEPDSSAPEKNAKDGLTDFDKLTKPEMRACIAKLIDSLPSIEDMRKHLIRKVSAGKSKPKLHEIDPEILPAAWLVLRWIIGSCTAYIEEITSGDEMIKNLDPNWRQFRLTVGAPDAEAKFKAAVEEAARTDRNAAKYPSLYAFHGSPLKNWHSIIRNGLWFKEIAHGRAYGHGIYLAKDGNVSMGSYAIAARTAWSKSQTSPTNCVALAQLVNLPSKFVSSNPYFVVGDTSWVMCRYLLLKGSISHTDPASSTSESKKTDKNNYVEIDPAHKPTLSNKAIMVPDPTVQIETLLKERRSEAHTYDEPSDEADMEVFNAEPPKASTSGRHNDDDDEYSMDLDDDDDYKVRPKPVVKAPPPPKRPADDWKHDPKYVSGAVERLMVPPNESSSSASNALQRELRGMLKEQEMAKSLKELGWYMPEEFIRDNLYQWIVELHSFDPSLPIAKDMKAKKVNSIIFELRFPPTFPNSPPFFRIITPRFLPFIHGGGGHVTGGGSICMDLLTADGWLPSYSIPAVLMQIKLAISNLDPRPARLAQNWHLPYDVREALEGFRRAAATHNWKVPEGLDRLFY